MLPWAGWGGLTLTAATCPVFRKRIFHTWPHVRCHISPRFSKSLISPPGKWQESQGWGSSRPLPSPTAHISAVSVPTLPGATKGDALGYLAPDGQVAVCFMISCSFWSILDAERRGRECRWRGPDQREVTPASNMQRVPQSSPVPP